MVGSGGWVGGGTTGRSRFLVRRRRFNLPSRFLVRRRRFNLPPWVGGSVGGRLVMLSLRLIGAGAGEVTDLVAAIAFSFDRL